MLAIFYNQERPDAHELFQAWRRDHFDGYFINCKSSRSGLLHRVECRHLGNVEWSADTGHDLTRQRKVCSLNLQELKVWAQHNGMAALSVCQHCRPIEDREFIEEEAKYAAVSDDFDFSDITDARQKVLASIVRRRGQPAFRQELLRIYAGRCAFSGCGVVDILEAAHITPYRGPETNHPQNGLLLRTDLHTLFDLGLLAVDTRDMVLVIAPALGISEYASLAGKPIAIPTDPAVAPSPGALDHHREKAGLARR